MYLSRQFGLVLKFCICCSIAAFITNVSADEGASAEPLSVIVNADTVLAKLDINSIRSIFTAKLTRWPNGMRIQFFVLPDEHPHHRHFVKNKLGLFPYQLRQIWDRLIFSGVGEGPVTVDSIDEMIEKVGAIPGAIGYYYSNRSVEKYGVQYVTLD